MRASRLCTLRFSGEGKQHSAPLVEVVCAAGVVLNFVFDEIAQDKVPPTPVSLQVSRQGIPSWSRILSRDEHLHVPGRTVFCFLLFRTAYAMALHFCWCLFRLLLLVSCLVLVRSL